MLTQDELEKVSDDDLNRRFRSVKNLIRNSRFSHEKKLELQIEFCYLHREIEIREHRKVAHEEWLKENRPNYRRRYNKSGGRS